MINAILNLFKSFFLWIDPVIKIGYGLYNLYILNRNPYVDPVKKWVHTTYKTHNLSKLMLRGV